VRATRRSPGLISLVLCLGLLAAGCATSKSAGSAAQPRRGGGLVLGAQQWPACLNPISQCASSRWTFWVADQYVLPKLMYLDAQNNPQPSALITETPTEANGGIKRDPFTLIFHLDPKAVWDDNTPITSADVEFTRQAYLATKGPVGFGYDQIESIDTTSTKTVVVRFKAPFADWPLLFGGAQGHVLKKAAFPRGPDVTNEMQTALPFSGMPWKLQGFTKDRAVLVRNTNYWVPSELPLLDQVTFVPNADQDAALSSLLGGQVSGIFRQPSPGFSKRLQAANVKYRIGGDTNFEGMWPNLSRPPLNDPQVRKALFMSVDRNEILNTFIKPDFPDAQLLNCGGWVPTVGKWCDNTQFADISYDPEGAKAVLQNDGWTPGADGVFAKDGQRLDLEFNTVSGNSRREQVQRLVISQAQKAGIAFHVNNYPRTQLVQEAVRHGNFGVAIFAEVADPNPSVTGIFACDAIPSPVNQFSGLNYSQWCDQAATAVMKQSDGEVDMDKRIGMIHEIGKAVRSDLVWLPFYQLPLVGAWRSDRVAGPIGDFTMSAYTNFWNINKWHLP